MKTLAVRRTIIRRLVRKWVADERHLYADQKWHEGSNEAHAIQRMATNDQQWWFDYIERYLNQARLQGLDSIQGRQALGKAIITCYSTLETSCLVYGPLPEPGVPSGEINKWDTWHG